jgi:hypothetical protein
MRMIDKFISDVKKQKLETTEVRCKWPYDYNDDFRAFEVTRENKVFYFCFGSEGQLIARDVRELK